jgi:hypothetical protein
MEDKFLTWIDGRYTCMQSLHFIIFKDELEVFQIFKIGRKMQAYRELEIMKMSKCLSRCELFMK